MNRLLTLTLIGLAGLLASCGSSVSSSTQPDKNDVYSMVISPIQQFTLNAGDWSTVSATVDLSYENSAARAISPQPTIKFSSSDPRVTISPSGEVCAGLWDVRYLTCTATADLPTGYVTITAFDASHNVGATTLLSVHQRAASISLTTDWGSNPDGTARTCISQNPPAPTPPATAANQVQYVATARDANGNAIPNVFANDYTWVVGDTNVASASLYGYIVARNPGVTNVYAKLNGTVSAPLTFVTCPPASITLGSSPYTNGTPILSQFSTADLVMDLGSNDQNYLTAEMLDTNGYSLVTSPLTNITSNPQTGGFSAVLPLTSKLTANTAGRFSVMAACEPTSCNAAVNNFVLPSGVAVTGQQAGFGYPIYSNVLGVTVQGTTSSTVLVTGTTLSDNQTPAHRLLAYDTESMAITHQVELANTPNSLVVAPNGAKAYVGDACPSGVNCVGLAVIDLASYQASLETFPITGGISTDVVTGKVIAVSPDSRYVVVSDGTLVFLIDTVQTKAAARFEIPGVNAATFAADGTSMWITSNTGNANTDGVYTYNGDAFVLTSPSSGLKAMAWTPDGQSFFASGNALANYSTCFQTPPQLPLSTPSLAGAASGPINLDTTVVAGVPYVVGLAGTEWLNYSVTTSSQVGTTLAGGQQGNVCKATVQVNPAAPPQTSTLGATCTATQVSFSPILQREFITGVNTSCTPSGIHGYDVNTNTEVVIPSSSLVAPLVVPLSGGVLNDGRKLYFGSFDSTNGALLHRIDLASGTEDNVTECVNPIRLTTANPPCTADNPLLVVTVPATVQLVPSFVAVVPK